MNESAAILARPESEHVIYGHLLAAEKWADTLRRLAGDFLALDTRPLVIHADTVTRIGPDPVPENLREMLREALIAVHQLNLTLKEARAYADNR